MSEITQACVMKVSIVFKKGAQSLLSTWFLCSIAGDCIYQKIIYCEAAIDFCAAAIDFCAAAIDFCAAAIDFCAGARLTVGLLLRVGQKKHGELHSACCICILNIRVTNTFFFN